ncbi:MAG: biotin--[acetyl-CoA-carboxylase] ligase [Candidatus Omnitrophica bacterium]|nr:biotin--[acetyl-CoA-carboxylase] ligase [Candidatus Omnitrophota bacterium]MCM8788290.1 biotin--[acetyl-CoA-carboxylase] ligase [Candidatus Omnitrophota bacterium]
MEIREIARKKVFFFEKTTSTMDIARQLCEIEFEPVIVAGVQTKGRGRQGRQWISDKGGLWVSVIWRDISRDLLNYLFVVVGFAIIETLRDFEISAKIKLPNDIYIRDQKIAGVLIENLNKCVIIGIGINVNNQISEKMDDATSCSEILGHFLELEKVLEHLLRNLYLARNQFETDAERFSNNIRGLLI